MVNLWKKFYCSVCSITFLDQNKNRLTSGTGFISNGYLITNNHVIQVPNATTVIIRFVKEDGYTEVFSKEYDYPIFMSFLKDGDDKNNWDYAILEPLDLIFKQIPSLKICNEELNEIGSSIAFLGFQFEQKNLSIHQGIISSTYISNSVKFIQLDSSVNHGNSGGPLIDLKKGEVIGIVTRKATGLTQKFENLVESFNKNITYLNEKKGGVFLNGVDPLEILVETQKQFKQTAVELSRSSNVGIGFAFSIIKVKESLAYLE